MCGIAGFAGNGTREALECMAQAIQRRGPDDEGFFISQGVGFAFRRLSIIDLQGGHQPLTSEDGNVWAMLNGEIYGFQQVRELLIGLGHVFRTSSDTEVIVHAYETWGDACFEKMNGMFAIAIWDVLHKRLILARDRLGKKPLYWTAQCGTLWFASELKALIAANVFRSEIDPVSFGIYFRTDAVPTPRTIFLGVQKLEPASFLAWSDGKEEKRQKFWSIQAVPDHSLSSQEAIAQLSHAIDISVRERLVSDVPLGIFLSGGLDSAVVAESVARQSSSRRLAFTIGFDDSSHNETSAAAEVARAFGFEHHVEWLREQEALVMLDEARDCLDEPLADPAILPQMLLARFARKEITVAVAGDGGDELLYGYQHVPAHAFAMRYPKFWQSLSMNKKLVQILPVGSGYFSFGFRLQRLARGLGIENLFARDLAWRGAWTAEDLEEVIIAERYHQIQSSFAEVQLEERGKELLSDHSFWQQWSWAYLRTFLMDEVMVKVDRATMWFGVEGRSPLLDSRVVETCFRIPDAYKLGAWKGKRLFKEILRGKLHESLLDRSKHGFGVPIALWLRGPLLRELQRLSESTFLKSQGWFNHEQIHKIIVQHASGHCDYRRELWAYLQFQRWWERWMEN